MHDFLLVACQGKVGGMHTYLSQPFSSFSGGKIGLQTAEMLTSMVQTLPIRFRKARFSQEVLAQTRGQRTIHFLVVTDWGGTSFRNPYFSSFLERGMQKRSLFLQFCGFYRQKKEGCKERGQNFGHDKMALF